MGKTSIVQNIAHGSFNTVHEVSSLLIQPTVYLDSVRKNIMHNGRMFRLVLWDTAGQEKFNSLVPSSIRGSQCAIIVFDLSNRYSFERCSHWLNMLRSTSNGADCAAILVGNKSDLNRTVTKE